MNRDRLATALDTYGAVSREWDAKVSEYGPLAEAAADADSEYKVEMAKFKVRLWDSGACRSDAEAETRGLADDRIGALYRRKQLTAAVRDAALEKLKQLRGRLDYGRSVVSHEREQDRLHATSGTP